MAARTRTAGLFLVLLPLLALVTVVPSVRADDEALSAGYIVPIPNPLTSPGVERIKQDVQKARDRKEKPAKVIVFDFNPAGSAAATQEFGSCYPLSNFIRELNTAGISTVAWVRGEVSGHTVLPVLACRRLAIDSQAVLGNDPNQPPPLFDEPERKAYEQVIQNSDRRGNAVPLKMVDPNVRLFVGKLAGGVRYYDGDKPPEGIVDGHPVDWEKAPDRKTGQFNAQQLHESGLVKGDERDTPKLDRLASVLGLDLASLSPASQFDAAGDAVWLVHVNGEVNTALEEAVKRRMDKAINRGARVIVLRIDNCGGGDIEAAKGIADRIEKLTRPTDQQPPVLVAAYIPNAAPDTAGVIAFACPRIFLGDKARLGDLKFFLTGPHPDTGQAFLKELAQKNGYPEAIIDGLAQRDLGLRLVHKPDGPRELKPFHKGDPGLNDIQGVDIKTPDLDLELTGQRAAKIGIAQVADSPEAVYGALGTDGSRVRTAEGDFFEALAGFLRSTPVMILLVMFGIGGLILELKIPGSTVPGIVSALCFTLFFWAFWNSAGIIWLAILLFILGLILLGMEIFVIPGFGVTGVSGILFVVAGLGLATVEQMPQTSAQWTQLGNTLLMLVGSLLGAVVGAVVVARFLPHVPFANRLILQPPEGESTDGVIDAGVGGIPTELAVLLGAIGEATTVLRPAGTARFGDRLVDVVSDGGFISPGALVKVIEIEGNRVVVRAAE